MCKCNGIFTPNESGSENEKDLKRSNDNQKGSKINDRHQRKFSLPLSLGGNGP